MRTDVRMGDASMTNTEAGNYDFVTAVLLVRGGPRYGGRFDSRKSVVGGLLLPEGEPVGGYVFSDEDCKVCFSGEEVRVYTAKRCCSSGFFIDFFVSRDAFMRRNPEEGDRGLRGNYGVEDMDAGNEWVRRRGVSYGRESRKRV